MDDTFRFEGCGDPNCGCSDFKDLNTRDSIAKIMSESSPTDSLTERLRMVAQAHSVIMMALTNQMESLEAEVNKLKIQMTKLSE